MLAQEIEWFIPPRDEAERRERAQFEPICHTCDGQGIVCPVCRGMRWVRMATEPVGADRRVQACDGCMGAVAGEGKASVIRTKELATIERFLRQRLVYLPPFDMLDPELRAEDDEALRRRDQQDAQAAYERRYVEAQTHRARWLELSGANRIAERRVERTGRQRLADLDTEAAQLDEQVTARYGVTAGFEHLVIAAARRGAAITAKSEKRSEKQRGSKQQ